MTAILDYEAAFIAGATRVGGKAWNMCRMARWGFPVPGGVIVSADVYDEIVQRPAIAKLIARAGALGASDIADAKCTKLLAELRSAMCAATLCKPHLEQLRQAIENAALSNTPVAIRSSATGEDGQQHAFAGIHQSFLNVVGFDEIVREIPRCFASLWTPQALAYRRRFNFEDSEVRGAVLICEMITAPQASEPIAAGVAFTADPSNGRRDTILIEATKGLGDKLVSGEVTPITTRVRMQLDGFNYEHGQTAPLPREALQTLILLAYRLHWAFSDGGIPQDIEWAYDGTGIVILQVRPVTSMPPCSYPQLLTQPVIWTNANFKEVLSGIVSPMGWSLMPQFSAAHFFDIHHLSGYTEPPGMQIVRRFKGRTYVDASVIQYAAFDAWGIAPAETNRSFGGFQPEITLPSTAPYKGLQGIKRALALARILHAVWRARKSLPQHLSDIEKRAKAFVSRDLAKLSNAELTQLWFSMSAPEWQPSFMLANAIGSLWLGIARQIGEKHLPTEELEPLMGGLMSGQGNIVSAEHAYELHEIVAKHGTNGSGFETALDIWLEKHGHRGFNEFDVANPRWRETRQDIKQFARQLGQAQHSPQSAQQVRHAAEEKLQSLPTGARKLLGWTIGKASEGFRLREQGKSALIAVNGMARHMILAFGDRMVNAHVMDRRDDVFMLTFADIWAWATGAWDGANARQVVLDRRLQTKAWQASEPAADVILDSPQGFKEISPVSRMNGDNIHGSGVSPGIARGIARKIIDPTQPGQLRDGGIIVARSTDPSWTPLFLSASGIVVEIGGYLSHGAIVAREFGLPAIVNAPGCFDAIQDGSDLMVDGNTGLVSLNSKVRTPEKIDAEKSARTQT